MTLNNIQKDRNYETKILENTDLETKSNAHNKRPYKLKVKR